ncbi:hypothetical protein IFM89_026017 [Coptis chinensis]|uniref:RNase H type-1 domain-containing protein n=1 Tax=Coptis chinensis TaxID=261450 RepID=A0A835LSU0_9MAGN|nr:hypothetical protein IFM89_026017 [Coptis chinensis]
MSKGWYTLWIETGSEAVTQAFRSGNVPWALQARWNNCTLAVPDIKITIIFREANYTADRLAKTGAFLAANERIICEGKPAGYANRKVHTGHYIDFSDCKLLLFL